METFYIFLFIHLISVVIGFGSVIVIDAFGLAWLLKLFGVDLMLVRKVANITQRLIWIGFCGLVASGIPMLMIKGRIDNLMMVKLFFVGMVGLNGVSLHFIKKSLEKLGENITDVPKKIYFRIGLASTISQLGWWSAASIGFYHRHITPFVRWPENPWMLIGLVIFLIGIAALVGEKVTNKPEQTNNPPSNPQPPIQ